MKLILFSLILSSGLNLNIDKVSSDKTSGLNRNDQAGSTIVFLKPIPGSIKVLEKVNFSFYVDQSVVSQYRYKIEIPKGLNDAVTDGLSTWSGWKSDYSINIRPQSFNKEGKYKFLVEYKLFTTNDTKLFEKSFEVKGDNSAANIASVKPSITKQAITLPQAETKKESAFVSEPKVISKPAIANRDADTSKDTLSAMARTDSKSSSEAIPVIQMVTAPEELKKSEPKTEIPEISKDYNKLLLESISEKNTDLFKSCIEMGGNTNISSDNGGNIFHLIAGKIEDENLIPVLTGKGNSINKKDSYGNTPLHYAILVGESEYARSLIHNGADLNIKNQQELTPLQLAAFLNNETVIKELLKKGADINSSGNTGYSSLHIAAELNYLPIAGDLLKQGAMDKLKTNQGLTSKTIAGIQQNREMQKLIKSKGSYSYNPEYSSKSQNHGLINNKSYPEITFNLAYDQELIRKRKVNTIVQWASIPVFLATSAAATFFHTKANGYFTDYKNAVTESEARDFYDKSGTYDTYSLISLTVSAGSVYSFIHSTIRKKNITNSMRKTF